MQCITETADHSSTALFPSSSVQKESLYMSSESLSLLQYNNFQQCPCNIIGNKYKDDQ